MKVLFACGGTAGHINPALAIAGDLKSRHPEAVIAFAGNPKGMEARLIPAAGYAFYPIEIMGFQRKLNWFNVKYNLRSAKCIVSCWGKVRKLLREFAPDMVVGTGGYVSGPVLKTAARLGYPTANHESNAYPGVTTKLLAKTVDKMLLVNKEAQERLPKGGNYVITGNPIRQEILFAKREAVRTKMGIDEKTVCIVSFGGSLGARGINNAVANLMKWEQQRGGFHHIHATGGYEEERFGQLLEEAGISPSAKGLDVRKFISDMPDCLAAADLVICRGGAMTVAEIEASGSAAILIPSPNVAENHQYHNAMVLQNHGGGIVLEEKYLTPKKLQGLVEELCANPRKLAQLGKNARALAVLDANERIYQELISLLPNT